MSKSVILCVDGEKMVWNTLRKQLAADLGDACIYEGAQDADEAFELMNELNDDEFSVIMIICDWLMPGIKGDELLIRIHEQFPNMIKIAIAGKSDSTAFERAKKQANIYRCLSKPWPEADLLETIKSGLSKL